MFEHSEKVPRSSKAAAAILGKAHSTESGESPLSVVRRLVDELHPRRFNIKALHELLVETVKRESSLGTFFSEIQLFENEPNLDPNLARVLLMELVVGKKGLAGNSKPVVAVRKYYDEHKERLDALKRETSQKTDIIPRYVRINTLKLSAADAIRGFQNEGWNLIRCTSGSYDDYLKQIQNLGEEDFLPDYHVKVVFVFPSKTPFADNYSYQEGELFLQDKATCLAGFLLAPTPGSTVLDMCAAPGMKTTHLAAIMRNEGVIYSVERDEERCGILKNFVESAGATCVKILNKDVLTITKDDCPSVDYILLDPSCSGSGMKRSEGNDEEHDFQSGRLEKLSRFQAKLLRHALNEFRSAKRLVYSTCSIYPQENEAVVQDVVKNHKGKFKLVSAKERLNNKWNNVGDLKYRNIGEKCIYARTETDYTSGFFIAIFEQQVNESTTELNGLKNEQIISTNGDHHKVVYETQGKSCELNDSTEHKDASIKFNNNLGLEKPEIDAEKSMLTEHVSEKKMRQIKGNKINSEQHITEDNKNNDTDLNKIDNPEKTIKKNKHKNNESMLDENASIEKVKNKKKRKFNEIELAQEPSEKNEGTELNNTDSIQNVVKKKKHRNDFSEDTKIEDNYNEPNEIESAENTNKIKKNKSKHSKICEIIPTKKKTKIQNENENRDQLCINPEEHSGKRKSKKEKCVVVDDEVEDIINLNTSKNKKNLRNNKKDAMIVDIVELEKPIKKKKSRKEKYPDGNDRVEENNGSTSKKEPRTNIEEDNRIVVDVDSHIEDSGRSTKNKKRKHSGNIESSCNFVDDVKSKKKKKKHLDE